MFLPFWTAHCIKSPSVFFKAHIFCLRKPGFGHPPLVKNFLFSECVPDQRMFGRKFFVYEYSVCFSVNAKVKLQIGFHFFVFLIVDNKLSSWLKRVSQILRNCSSHSSISFILFFSRW